MQICFYFDFKTSVLKDFYYVFSYSVCSLLDIFLRSTGPSSLYIPVDCLSSLFDNKNTVWMPKNSQFWLHQNCPWWGQSSFLYFVSSKACYHCIIRIAYHVLLYASLFLEYRRIAGQRLISSIPWKTFLLQQKIRIS